MSVSSPQPHHRRGGFSRATAYAATFLGALAQAPSPSPSCHHPVFATTRTPSPSSLLVVSLEDATAIVYASNLFTLSVTILCPRSYRGAVVYTIFGTSDRAIESFYDSDALEKTAAFVGRERAAIEGDLPACELRLPFEVFAFIRTRDFRDVSFRVI